MISDRGSSTAPGALSELLFQKPEMIEASLEMVHGFDAVKTVSELTRLLRRPGKV